MIPRDQQHGKQIAAYGKEQKRIVGDGEEDQAENAVLQEKSEQVADRQAHARAYLADG